MNGFSRSIPKGNYPLIQAPLYTMRLQPAITAKSKQNVLTLQKNTVVLVCGVEDCLHLVKYQEHK